MQDAVQPDLEDIEAKRCPRCLQPVPPKASRCPGCGQPIHTLRLLPLALGAVGLLALVFALLVMFRMMRNEDQLRAPVPADDGGAQQGDVFPDPAPPNNKANQPPKPEKRPPLNER
jgi:hypothetical protein